MMRGCSSPITSFVNIWIHDIFTFVFGMVGTCLTDYLARGAGQARLTNE